MVSESIGSSTFLGTKASMESNHSTCCRCRGKNWNPVYKYYYYYIYNNNNNNNNNNSNNNNNNNNNKHNYTSVYLFCIFDFCFLCYSDIHL